MGFTNVTRVRAIPSDSTAVYTFHDITLPGATAPVAITVRHAGDGTPSYSRAEWELAERMRVKYKGQPERLSETKTRERIADEIKLIASHCAVSWANVLEDDGSIAPCTAEKVQEFLCAVLAAPGGIEAIHEFRVFARDAANFRPAFAVDATALGKA